MHDTSISINLQVLFVLWEPQKCNWAVLSGPISCLFKHDARIFLVLRSWYNGKVKDVQLLTDISFRFMFVISFLRISGEHEDPPMIPEDQRYKDPKH